MATIPTGTPRWVGPCKINWAALQQPSLTGGDASGGTFTVTINGETTSALAWDVSAADLKTALEALPSIGAGNVDVAPAWSGNPWVDVNSSVYILFKDATATGLATADVSLITGPSAPYTMTFEATTAVVPTITPAVGDIILDFFHVVQTAFTDTGPAYVTYQDNPNDTSAPNWSAPVVNTPQQHMHLDEAQKDYTNLTGSGTGDPANGISSAWTFQSASYLDTATPASSTFYSTLPAVVVNAVPIYTVINGNGDGDAGEVWIWVLLATPAPMGD